MLLAMPAGAALHPVAANDHRLMAWDGADIAMAGPAEAMAPGAPGAWPRFDADGATACRAMMPTMMPEIGCSVSASALLMAPPPAATARILLAEAGLAESGLPAFSEPPAWAQVIGGLCLVGLSLRRRGWMTVAA